MASFQKHFDLFLMAASNIALRNQFRSLTVTCCLIAIIFPFLTGLSISQGIKFQSRIALQEGADFFIAGDGAGSNVPLHRNQVDRFRSVPGVFKIIPRIVGRAYLGERVVTIVGIPQINLPTSINLLEGRIFQHRGDVVVGNALARRYDLDVGRRFYLPINRWKTFQVVGSFSHDCTIWSANLVFMSIDDASELFRLGEEVTDFLVYAHQGETETVNVHLQLERKEDPPIRVQSRQIVQSYMERGFGMRAGIFSAFYLVAFALAIPSVSVIAGMGWGERKKEITILKGIGWQTFDVMEMIVYENLLLSATSACLALLVCFAWIELLNGFFIAQFFIGEQGLMPDFPVPAKFDLLIVFISFLLSLTITMAGSLFYTWKTAIMPPAKALR